MHDDQPGRVESLNAYLDCGEWEKATAFAKKEARTQLPRVFYELGKKCESEGCFGEAIRAYESAGVHIREVPRMLLKAGKVSELETYVREKGERELWTWWGRYCASLGSRGAAFEAFAEAEDVLSLTKLYWSLNDREAAVKAAREKRDTGSLFYVARQYEMEGDIGLAIGLFAESGYPDVAIRVAMTHGKNELLYDMAGSAPVDALSEIASHFEQSAQRTRAARLYARAGRLSKALQTAVHSNCRATFVELLERRNDVTTSTDTDELGERFAEACLHFSLHEEAVYLFAKAGRIERALRTADEHDVALTEDVVERLSSAVDTASPLSQEEKNAALISIGEACLARGSYLLAAKKFTAAGARLESAKALIKAGDVDRVISFATRSRSAEVLTLVGNFLRTLEWSEDEELVKKIILFYTKANAKVPLARFHETRAQVEIDEFRDYERGAAALHEARSVLETTQDSSALDDLDARIRLVEEFLRAREHLHTDSSHAFSLCEALLPQLDDEPESASLRRGDVFSLMIEFSHSQGDFRQSGALLQRMREHGLRIELYIEASIIHDIDLHG